MLISIWWLLPALGCGIFLSLLLNIRRQQALTANLQQTTVKLAVAEEKLIALQKKEQECLLLQQQCLQLQTERTELNTRIQEQQNSNAEKIRLLQDAEQQLKIQFENLAHKIFEERGRQFSEQNRLSVENIVAPLKTQIGEFKTRVESVYDNESKDRISLREEILSLRRDTAKMNQEALNLTKALKGDHKTQGNWGEMILEKVLEQSGLRKGVEYDIQTGLR
ncbi:MAG: DNA recombination protein RmuC, partial [Methylomonas sp.]